MENKLGRKPVNPINRFHRFYVKKTNGCWAWTNRLTGGGYGQITVENKYILAHRFAYEVIGNKPIPKGYDIDHLCHNRDCVNPDHLEAVTRAENIRRGETGKNAGRYNKIKTHCKRGHKYTPENTIIQTRQGRFGVSKMRRCRECMNLLRRVGGY